MTKMTDSKIKEIFLEVFEAKMGSPTEACKGAHISRQTYYQWLKKFPNFLKQVNAIKESLIDKAESQLHENVKLGNQKAIEFALINLKRDTYSKDNAPVVGNLTVNIGKSDRASATIVKMPTMTEIAKRAEEAKLAQEVKEAKEAEVVEEEEKNEDKE